MKIHPEELRIYEIKRILFSMQMKSLNRLQIEQKLDRDLIKSKLYPHKREDRFYYSILHRRITQRRLELENLNRWLKSYYELTDKYGLSIN